jgi:beta-N-acetylhexosaminidase
VPDRGARSGWRSIRRASISSILRRVFASSALLLALSPALSAAAAPPGEAIVSALAGPPKPSFLAKVDAGELGGVILVGRWTRQEMRRTTAQLHAAGCAAGRPLLLLVDQEGGFARRLTWAAPTYTARELGGLGVARTRVEARAAAVALRGAGIDVDLAPVTDTLVPGGFLGSRAFGGDPSLVGTLAAAFVEELQAHRIAATTKHFPGLGTARVSTDDHRVSLRSTELAPFRTAIAAGVKLVMVSNASYPALDNSGAAAVFSRPIVTDLLRRSYGFDGVVVSDALDAPTPARTPDAPARALAAGVDLLLYTSGSAAHAAYIQLAADAHASPAVRAHLAQAVGRIRALKHWLGRGCSR